MRICVLAEEGLKNELIEKGIPGEVEVIWADTLKVMNIISDIDVYFDLLFSTERERIAQLLKLSDKPVFINAVNETLADLPGSFFRINAWPTMLKRKITELAMRDQSQENIVSAVFKTLKWEYLLVPDITGMVTPRVISMIVNEAYFTLEQEVSSKEEIDTAMKLGTNYPMGPFEWSQQIGLNNILSLLEKLAIGEDRYQPSGLLEKEASNCF